MTYCLGIKLDAGLVFASDSRITAGIDSPRDTLQFSRQLVLDEGSAFGKLPYFPWEV
jgi:predicted proteasome-type protease